MPSLSSPAFTVPLSAREPLFIWTSNPNNLMTSQRDPVRLKPSGVHPQSGRNVELDFQRLKSFRMGFAGLVVMLEKTLQRQGRSLTIVGLRPQSPAP